MDNTLTYKYKIGNSTYSETINYFNSAAAEYVTGSADLFKAINAVTGHTISNAFITEKVACPYIN